MQLVFKLNNSAEEVVDYLSDMQKFVSVHPVIQKMIPVGNNQYRVHETLKFGFLRFSFRYPAWVEKSADNQTVVIRATVFKLTKIELTFFIQTKGNEVVVVEDVVFRSPLPVHGVMRRVFKTQHALLFKNIAALATKGALAAPQTP